MGVCLSVLFCFVLFCFVLFVCFFIYLFVYLFCLFVCLFVCLLACLLADLSVHSHTLPESGTVCTCVCRMAADCGNGLCESGEQCSDLLCENAGACAVDCPYPILSCPAPYLGGTMCSGRGVCLVGMGACECFPGYDGIACELCQLGYKVYNEDAGCVKVMLLRC